MKTKALSVVIGFTSILVSHSASAQDELKTHIDCLKAMTTNRNLAWATQESFNGSEAVTVNDRGVFLYTKDMAYLFPLYPEWGASEDASRSDERTTYYRRLDIPGSRKSVFVSVEVTKDTHYYYRMGENGRHVDHPNPPKYAVSIEHPRASDLAKYLPFQGGESLDERSREMLEKKIQGDLNFMSPAGLYLGAASSFRANGLSTSNMAPPSKEPYLNIARTCMKIENWDLDSQLGRDIEQIQQAPELVVPPMNGPVPHSGAGNGSAR